MDIKLLVPLIIALVEVVKRLGVKKRFLPLISVVLGIGLNLLIVSALTPESLLMGAVLGCSACGLFDLGKKSILNK